MTDDEALETLFAMANVQDGYAKKATDPGLKLIHKANAKAQREVAATIKDLRARLAAAEAQVAALREERDALETAREMLGGFWAEAIADRDRLAAANAALEAQVAADADLLLDAYKAVLVLHRTLDKLHLAAGAKTAENIADRIVAAHPEMPARASLRAALAEVQADARREGA